MAVSILAAATSRRSTGPLGPVIRPLLLVPVGQKSPKGDENQQVHRDDYVFITFGKRHEVNQYLGHFTLLVPNGNWVDHFQ
jgi:hypothetical protein